MTQIRVLIADDHDLIRRGVRDLLATRSGWRIVGEACDGVDAVRQAVCLKPDVAILDFSMPRMNGPEASAQITERLPDTAVIILTVHDSDEVIDEVLRSGARGLVLKSDADRILVGAVDAIVEERHFFMHRRSDVMMEGYPGSPGAGRPRRRSPHPQLTEREEEVVRLLASGFANKEIAHQLQISTRTVESHRININRKLSFNSLAELVRYAIRNGIVSAA